MIEAAPFLALFATGMVAGLWLRVSAVAVASLVVVMGLAAIGLAELWLMAAALIALQLGYLAGGALACRIRRGP